MRTTTEAACREVELVALRRVAPRGSGATNLTGHCNFERSECPLRGQTLSQRDNIHHSPSGRFAFSGVILPALLFSGYAASIRR